MTISTDQLTADITQLCTHLFEPLGIPVVKQQLIPTTPIRVRVGVTIPEVPP